MIDGSDFGLDPKDAKQNKIIADVTKTMRDATSAAEDIADNCTDAMDRMDKVLTHLCRRK
jgi:hypothetical protein